MDRCLELEPGYHNCRSHKALALLLKGDEDAALAEVERTVASGAYRSRSEHFVVPLLRRGNRLAAWMMLDAQAIDAELRAVLVSALEHPERPRPDLAVIEQRFLSNPDAEINRDIGASRIYLWLGAFDRIATTNDAPYSTILQWERDPPEFRNSPAMKQRLADMGVVSYWRTHGYPPQCSPRDGEDFHCD
jgi:hypothetical protein